MVLDKHKCAVIVYTVQTESLANTNILASVDSLFCRFEDGHGYEEILQVI